MGADTSAFRDGADKPDDGLFDRSVRQRRPIIFNRCNGCALWVGCLRRYPGEQQDCRLYFLEHLNFLCICLDRNRYKQYTKNLIALILSDVDTFDNIRLFVMIRYRRMFGIDVMGAYDFGFVAIDRFVDVIMIIGNLFLI